MTRRRTKHLGEVCSFTNGLWTGKKGQLTKAGVFRNTNFRPHGVLDDTDVAFLDVEQRQLDKRRLEIGDIIIEKSGGGPKQAVGRVAYFDKAGGPFSFSNFTAAARVIDSREVDPRFLVKFLDWCYISGVTAGMQSHSTGIRNLDFAAYKALEVPLPPLEEQRRIVAVLDEAFAAIATATANTEKNLANARETRALLHRRAFAEVGGRQALGDLAAFRNGVNFTSNSRGEEVRIVGVKDFQDNVFVPDGDLATVRVDGILPDDDLLRSGDILTVRSNGNKALIGRCMIAASVDERTTHSGFTIRIRADGCRIDPEYLCRYLKSPEARERLVAGGAGANISSLNQKVLASLPVPVPLLADQRRIAGVLEEIDDLSKSLEAVSQAKLIQLTALKQSLLHRAFSGELTEREPLAA